MKSIEALTAGDLAAMGRAELEALIVTTAALMAPECRGSDARSYRMARRVQFRAQQRLQRLQREHEVDAQVLGGLPARPTRADIEAAFRAQARACHPDAGGSADAFHQLVSAKSRALKWCVD